MSIMVLFGLGCVYPYLYFTVIPSSYVVRPGQAVDDSILVIQKQEDYYTY